MAVCYTKQTEIPTWCNSVNICIIRNLLKVCFTGKGMLAYVSFMCRLFFIQFNRELRGFMYFTNFP